MSEANQTPVNPSDQPDYAANKWIAFTAIGISFFTMVASMGMVFLALAQIAETFDMTLRSASWVVIAQGLTISAFMLPMGRMADIIGRKKAHLIGLFLFGSGSVFTAFAPTFVLLILARIFASIGNAMGQSVGTAMVLSIFPAHERGKAIGALTTSVAVGGATGPVIAGLVLQFLPWEALFLMLTVPIGIAFVAGYFILDEKVVSQERTGARESFDWTGAIVSGLAITLLVILINNPFGVAILSPLVLGGTVSAVCLVAFFVWWELKSDSPMLQLRMFKNLVLSMAIATRFLGFLGTTTVRFLMPIYLISLRDIQEAAAGGILFLTSLGMAVAASSSGRLGDRIGERPFTIVGFLMLVVTAMAFAVFTSDTSLWVIMVVLLINGLAMGIWGVPNNSTILGSVPRESYGVVGALTNLTRNVGNVAGQAVASAVVVGVMAADGFDIPLSEITGNPAASASFLEGWKLAYILVTIFSLMGLALAIFTKPQRADQPD